jgi:hypothetical protein
LREFWINGSFVQVMDRAGGMPTSLDAQEEVLSMAPIVVLFLNGVHDFTEEQVRGVLRASFPSVSHISPYASVVCAAFEVDLSVVDEVDQD